MRSNEEYREAAAAAVAKGDAAMERFRADMTTARGWAITPVALSEAQAHYQAATALALLSQGCAP